MTPGPLTGPADEGDARKIDSLPRETARTHRNGFLRRFDPRLALEESRRETGEAGDIGAHVLITHEAGEEPASMKLFREDPVWRETGMDGNLPGPACAPTR